jgi:hypothetical protein
MFTRFAVAAAVALAVANIASAQGFNSLSQQAIDFQRNCEVGCQVPSLPTKPRAPMVAPRHDSLTQQAIDFQKNGEVAGPVGLALTNAYASGAPKHINRYPVVATQPRDFQNEPGR